MASKSRPKARFCSILVLSVLLHVAFNDSIIALGMDDERKLIRDAAQPQNVPRIKDLKCTQLPASTQGGSDPSFRCEFVVAKDDRVEKIVANQNDSLLDEVCDETNLFCMRARVTKSTLSSIETQPIASIKSEEAGQDSEAKATFTTKNQSTETTRGMAKEHPLSLLLREFYERPYSQYGETVEALLHDWFTTQAAIGSLLPRGMSRVEENEDNFVVAEWMHQIGRAHQNAADSIRLEMGILAVKDDQGEENVELMKHVNWSVRAFRQALQYYEGIEENVKSDDDPWFATLKQLHMAIVYYNIAEIFAVSQDSKQAKLDKDYYLQAERLFSNCKTPLMEPPPSLDSTNTVFPYLYEEEQPEGGGIRSIESFWREARLAWGQTNLRLGEMELSINGAALEMSLNDETLNMADLQPLALNLLQQPGGGGNGFFDLEQQQEEGAAEKLQQALGELLKNKLPQFLESTERAKVFFQNAADLFRQILEEDPDEEDLGVELQLGQALQHLGTTATTEGDTVRAIEHLEESLEVYQTAIEKSSEYEEVASSVSDANAKQNVGEILISLSNAYLRQGNYEMANTYYHRSMEWYRDHGLPPMDAAIGKVPEGTPFLQQDDTYVQSIKDFERMLEQYEELFTAGGVGVNRDDLDGGGMYYIRDHGYEADLHSGLGTLYMSTGDFIEATVHITQALRLYSLNGEQGERHYADLKYNQAMLFFWQGEYHESAMAHEEALELYQQIVGDDVDPLPGSGFLDVSTLRSIMEEAERSSSNSNNNHPGKQPETTTTAKDKTIGHPGGDDTNTITNTMQTTMENMDLYGDGTERLKMNIRPMALPEELLNETTIDAIVPNVGAQ